MTERPLVIVVAKAPALGRGKSRLAQELGVAEALRINRFLHRATIRAAIDVRWDTVLAVTPDRTVYAQYPTVWPAEISRIAQHRGDLGDRLARIAQNARDRTVAMIGTDCLVLSRTQIWRAFCAARRDGVHAIPATDGGFVLLAARRGAVLDGAFHPVRWSSAHTLGDMTNNLRARGQCISTAAPLPDVDTPADWRAAVRARISAS